MQLLACIGTAVLFTQSSSNLMLPYCCARYASRANKYAIQRRNIVAQAGIQDSLLCSTATGTAATSSSNVSSIDTAAGSSFSTLQTDSSLFASPALDLPVVPEACNDVSCNEQMHERSAEHQ